MDVITAKEILYDSKGWRKKRQRHGNRQDTSLDFEIKKKRNRRGTDYPWDISDANTYRQRNPFIFADSPRQLKHRGKTPPDFRPYTCSDKQSHGGTREGDRQSTRGKRVYGRSKIEIGSKIMAATNWTVIRRDKTSGKIVMYNLESKWTYKTALGIATESNINETHDLVCVVETSKILLKNEKEAEKKE